MMSKAPTHNTLLKNEIRIEQRLAEWAQAFETTIQQMLKPPEAVPQVLAQAMQYSVQGGGKRVRAYIVTRFCELCGGTAKAATPAAVALECVHAFSLVHDDLPAMDDDDLRRGRPTCHKAFGEAVAILAGDALLALAFELLTDPMTDPRLGAAAVLELARGTGWAGMIGGQTTDILSEGDEPSLAVVEHIHRYKTARLLETAGRLGAISAAAGPGLLAAAGAYGDQLGRAFQIADDLLDVTGDAATLGKAVAKDAEAGKQTYPAAVGIEASRKAAGAACDRAIEALNIFGPAADDLRALARFVIERNH
ncbi:MAG TPA: polyprenyl synthetase family protein [Phycisphaerae bacterium]|nr:polyprenyl synthetase family protein [Phycisphaerae bacterium]HRY67645.1 polyprenyl synthetase family protein [Phycisphaerae bacterium]HSA25032.1 polyprenyl synthetase family protein [Phycisphaerae bacterium]